MLRIHLIRHGHTVWNDTGGVAGRTDIDLSESGQLAVSELARSVPGNSELDSWHSSPLKRTRDTTMILREDMPTRGILPDVIIDDRLVELNFGDWEGLTWQVVHERYQHEMERWGQDWINHSPPNGETFAQLTARCSDFLQEMSLTTRTEHTGVIVLHGGSIRALVCHCLGWPLTRAMDFNVDPATVTTLDLDRGSSQWTVRKVNSLSF